MEPKFFSCSPSYWKRLALFIPLFKISLLLAYFALNKKVAMNLNHIWKYSILCITFYTHNGKCWHFYHLRLLAMPYNHNFLWIVSTLLKCCSKYGLQKNEVALWLHQHYNGDVDLEKNGSKFQKIYCNNITMLNQALSSLSVHLTKPQITCCHMFMLHFFLNKKEKALINFCKVCMAPLPQSNAECGLSFYVG